MTAISVFVGGPIQYAMDPSETRFDVGLRNRLEALHTYLEHGGITVLSAHRTEKFGEGNLPTPSEVVSRDLRFTRECDVYLAFLPMNISNAPYRTDGTHVELGWATALGVPVVIMWDSSRAAQYSYLVQGLAAAGGVQFVDFDEYAVDPKVLYHALRLSANSTMDISA